MREDAPVRVGDEGGRSCKDRRASHLWRRQQLRRISVTALGRRPPTMSDSERLRALLCERRSGPDDPAGRAGPLPLLLNP